MNKLVRDLIEFMPAEEYPRLLLAFEADKEICKYVTAKLSGRTPIMLDAKESTKIFNLAKSLMWEEFDPENWGATELDGADMGISGEYFSSSNDEHLVPINLVLYRIKEALKGNHQVFCYFLSAIAKTHPREDVRASADRILQKIKANQDETKGVTV